MKLGPIEAFATHAPLPSTKPALSSPADIPTGGTLDELAEAAKKTTVPNNPTKEVLDNGVRVMYRHVPGARSVSVKIGVPVGSGNDPSDRKGLAHLTEHLVFRGNPGMEDEKVWEFINRSGGRVNAYTAPTHTVYEMEVSPPDAERAARRLASLFRTPEHDRTSVDQETRIIQHEHLMRSGNRDVQASLEHYGNVEGEHVVDQMIPTQESVQRITPSEVKEFAETFYTGANTVVMVEGDRDHMPLDAIREELSKLPSGTPIDQLPVETRKKYNLPVVELPIPEGVNPKDLSKDEIIRLIMKMQASKEANAATKHVPSAQLKVVPDAGKQFVNVAVTIPFEGEVDQASKQLLTSLAQERMFEKIRMRGQMTYTPSVRSDGNSLTIDTVFAPTEVREGVAAVIQGIKGLPRLIEPHDVTRARRKHLTNLAMNEVVRTSDDLITDELLNGELPGRGHFKNSFEKTVDALRSAPTDAVRDAARALDLADMKITATGSAFDVNDIQGALDDAKTGVEIERVPFKRSRWEHLARTPTGQLTS